LPSHREGQRWDLSKKFSQFMEEAQARVAIYSQKVNDYTGTDYSGIAALRQEIKDQEELVKQHHKTVAKAKESFDAAHAEQAASQKEVVGLLERKHSWSAGDLERYMSLIRSEHVNEQNVQGAKDALLAAERSLEEARARLEKRERAQYHEEQVWSDTIRRNSTWVTFGLMGFNIFLLLANLVIIEPWRRRRMVKEIKGVMAENQPIVNVASAAPVANSAVEQAIDEVVEPQGVVLEEIDDSSKEIATTAPATSDVPAAEPLVEAVVEPLSQPAPVPAEPEVEPEAEPITPETPAIQPSIFHSEGPWPWATLQSMADDAQSYLADLFSERPLSVKKVDMTVLALQAATAGAAVFGTLVVL
ncbi:hypothetical protein K402DRAFT_297680, partial [Aulographum hederae CBS 113979]